MRRIVLAGAISLGILSSALLPRVAAAQQFQGTMSFTVHDANGGSTRITQVNKPGKSSFMANGQGDAGGIIVDSAAGTMTLVDGRSKTYSVISTAMMKQMMAGMGDVLKNALGDSSAAPTAPASPQGTLTATGKSEVVAGVKCQVYLYDGMEDGKHETGEACLAKGAGMLAGGSALAAGFPGMGGRNQRQAMQKQLTKLGPLGAMLSRGYGIMRATNNEDGKFKGSMEVTAYQPGTPPDAAFEPPAGYTTKEMKGMMGAPQ